MTVGIYGAFDSISGECLYVGQSKHVEKRWRQHITKLKNDRSHLKDFIEWFHENGDDETAIEFRLLEKCANDDLLKNQLERKWFFELRPRFYGRVPALYAIWNHSPETSNKIGVSVARARPKQVHFVTCKACKKEFNEGSRARQFCSQACKFEGQRKIVDVDRVIMHYLSGMTLMEVAELENVSYVTISKILDKNNIAKRGRSKNAS